jgi:hypothetical protein
LERHRTGPVNRKESPLDNLAGAHVTDLRGFVLVRKRCCTGTPKGSPRDKLDYGYGYAAAGRTV